jgi:hypothetical protein
LIESIMAAVIILSVNSFKMKEKGTAGPKSSVDILLKGAKINQPLLNTDSQSTCNSLTWHT